MSGWQITSSMPDEWPSICAREHRLFHSRDWLQMLERSFGCASLYAINTDLQLAAGISAFRAGPFHVGYLGFPAGGFIGEGLVSSQAIDSLRIALRRSGLVCLRIPISAFPDAARLDLPVNATPETAIVDLQSWSLATVTKNRRRDVRRSQRSGLDVADATDEADGSALFDMYRTTIKKHRGSLRYTAGYFSELIRLARQRPDLRVLLAKQGDSIAAFAVAARHGAVGFYLHGAYDWDLREHIPSALLLNEAIEWAQAEGCRMFNLMSSPPAQGSLIRYKEQWGAETREHRVHTLPIRPSYPLFQLAERLYRLVH